MRSLGVIVDVFFLGLFSLLSFFVVSSFDNLFGSFLELFLVVSLSGIEGVFSLEKKEVLGVDFSII